ncbi:PxxKW family cysteine-rich protein [Desulfovibrio cuneatus]|uniref:PxxKW family cysteine-rich protein n=1 Tax=Desulfovibrio cuneatus TaxID=159728 RepID=UPI0004234D2B
MSATPNTFSGATMSAEGMVFNGAVFQPVVEKCEGCNRVREFEGQRFCSAYPMPEAKWSLGNCNFSTHAKQTQAANVKVNPLKASKRAAKGR